MMAQIITAEGWGGQESGHTRWHPSPLHGCDDICWLSEHQPADDDRGLEAIPAGLKMQKLYKQWEISIFLLIEIKWQ